jgi:hypothetical protein
MPCEKRSNGFCEHCEPMARFRAIACVRACTRVRASTEGRVRSARKIPSMRSVPEKDLNLWGESAHEINFLSGRYWSGIFPA